MQHKQGVYEKYIKRLIDIICSIVVFVLFWWLYIILAVLVRMKLGTPILFRQQRSGQNGRIFNMYKFRTMTDKRDKSGNLLSDEERLTKFGKELRATSLDELPEIFNILKGDMSLIGPRPLLPKDVACMNSIQVMRHCVRPGLTGLAQCSGRNLLDWDVKLSKDVEYVSNLSFGLDVRIAMKTIYKVFKHEGVEYDAGTEMDLKDWNELKKEEQ